MTPSARSQLTAWPGSGARSRWGSSEPSETASPDIWYGIFGDADFGATLGQLGVQGIGVAATFVVVFGLSMITFFVIKQTIGLRVSEAEETAGLDISSHGMYGYPEAFIPQEEYPADGFEPHVAGTPVVSTAVRPTPKTPGEEVTA
jgi:Amt family ammonium transporter